MLKCLTPANATHGVRRAHGHRAAAFALSSAIGVSVLGVHPSPQRVAEAAGTPSIVVEAVEKGSAGHKAGILPGDVLTSWERAASPPANPSTAQGARLSPFDLAEIEVEQAPRGPVTLFGSRGAGRLAISIPVGRWRITGRPAMAPNLSESNASARALAAAGELDKAVRTGAPRQRMPHAAKATVRFQRGCSSKPEPLFEMRTGWTTHTP